MLAYLLIGETDTICWIQEFQI